MTFVHSYISVAQVHLWVLYHHHTVLQRTPLYYRDGFPMSYYMANPWHFSVKRSFADVRGQFLSQLASCGDAWVVITFPSESRVMRAHT